MPASPAVPARALRRRVGRHEIIWQSEEMRRTMTQVERVATGVYLLKPMSSRKGSYDTSDYDS